MTPEPSITTLQCDIDISFPASRLRTSNAPLTVEPSAMATMYPALFDSSFAGIAICADTT